MLFGFVIMAVLDSVLDLVHIVRHVKHVEFHVSQLLGAIALVAHMIYSFYFSWYCVPLLRQHIGFVLRNELTQEWKRDDFNIIYNQVGDPVAVNELSEEEYNEQFDNFVY